jgi:beta-lactamase superfamily II metal-dependent hydrolase
MAEKFLIKYYDMGQGDCILIVCPDGKLVVIDCGSTKAFGADSVEMLNVCQSIRKYTSKNNRKVDILILTHKDKDHYNQVGNIFLERTCLDEDEEDLYGIDIDTVYFSSPPVPSADYALTQFKQNSTGGYIIGNSFKTNEIKQVFINSSVQKVVTYTKDKAFVIADGTTEKITGYKLTLLSDTTPGNKNWSVSIIAGQVPETNKPVKKKSTEREDPTNALSLVTLVQIGDSKALFLGDATKATETFLLSKQKKLITDIDFVHIPHHGSLTSSSQDFVNAVNPKGAEVTHEPFETGNRLPRQVVLQRWLDKLDAKDKMDDHMIDYWKQIKRSLYEKTIAAWQSKGWDFAVINRATYLSRIPKKFKNNYICLYKGKNDYWGLYRTQTDVNLCGTGADDYNSWDLPA